MPSRRSRPPLEDRLAALSELRRDPDSEASLTALAAALESRESVVVARAAKLVAELAKDELAAALAAAFERFMERPAETDKGCLAKTAVVKALVELDQPAVAVFRRGLRHVQLEPTWGGSVDTAVEVRANCALGLVNAGHPRAVVEIVPLLLDAALPVRLAAAQAIGAAGRSEAEAVLRFKVLAGDDEPEVLADCLAGLLHLEPERSLDFVAAFLDGRDALRREAAILALGESRREEAVPLLLRQLERAADAEGRRLVLLALVTTRRESALDFLLDRVAAGERRAAGEAIAALAVLRHDERIRERLAAAVERNPARAELRARLARELG